jgi:hypothetical protein
MLTSTKRTEWTQQQYDAANRALKNHTVDGKLQYRRLQEEAPELWDELTDGGKRGQQDVYSFVNRIRAGAKFKRGKFAKRKVPLAENGLLAPVSEMHRRTETASINCHYCPVCGGSTEGKNIKIALV